MINLLFSYIDPTSTSALLYVVIALVVSIVFSFKAFFYRLKNIRAGEGFLVKKDSEGIGIIFYSGDKQYWPVFFSVIKILEKKPVYSASISSDNEDPGLPYQSAYYKSKYIGKLTKKSVYPNRLKTKFGLKNESVFNFAKAGGIAANQTIEIVDFLEQNNLRA